MNPQQLQSERAARWRQTGPDSALLTTDAASAWLEDIGLCLFLPRHSQLPAPAPSFVEACVGAASITPPPSAVAQGSELAYGLLSTGRALPLNLLGGHSEQADFLVTPDVLPWVAAVRGDRQWRTAPGGRTSPLILRTWEALDSLGESTAVELREVLGRELTEAAVLRALIELWTMLRAIPLAGAAGEPTHWTLLKNRYPAQLATAANTAQTTGLSALLSIYLRAAVAATAEEAEIFLSPLTSRSRIREVLHGMMAAGQFATMSVGSQTLLFVEGSLPELPAEPEPPALERAPRPASQSRPFDRRPPFRDARRPPNAASRFQKPRHEGPQPNEPPFEKPRSGDPVSDKPRFDKPRFEKPRFDKPRFEKPRPEESRPGNPRSFNPRPGNPRSFNPRPGNPRSFNPRPGNPNADQRPSARSGSKPWQRRRESGFGNRPEAGARHAVPGRPRPWQKRDENRPDPRRGDRPGRPSGTAPSGGGKRPFVGNSAKDSRPSINRETGRPWRGQKSERPGQRWGNRPPRDARSSSPAGRSGNARPFRGPRPSGDARPSGNGRPFRGPRPPGEARSSGRPRPPREDRSKPFQSSAKNPRPAGPSGRRNLHDKPPSSRSRPAKPFKKTFRKSNSFPEKRNPRKNRSQEENPE